MKGLADGDSLVKLEFDGETRRHKVEEYKKMETVELAEGTIQIRVGERRVDDRCALGDRENTGLRRWYTMLDIGGLGWISS